MKLDLLPEDCIAHVLSCTSPRDACGSSLVSSAVRSAAGSNVVWEKFLPSDYHEIMSRLVFPVAFTTKKDLFTKLSTPLLIDGGKKTFTIDKPTSKKCYMLSARELHITWSSNALYWCWKPFLQSRFAEVAELVMVCWLEIHGKINARMLSPNTTYGAYLVVKFAERAFGLDSLPSDVSVEVGDKQSRGTIYLRHKECREKTVTRERDDGWLEIELGAFYNDGSEKEVKMGLKEVEGVHLKGGLIVEGIELRPK
ncbi:hypothetical protein RJ640_013700 [Escallonia rubra]|uniref:F-box domain-containing protein n=1 Tax=Escallonia rubra TaxID=112253 RepID=A0AA88U147_9ASTE|nr:hypothetical protein RJ640_013700 [Escallonia rubra]